MKKTIIACDACHNDINEHEQYATLSGAISVSARLTQPKRMHGTYIDAYEMGTEISSTEPPILVGSHGEAAHFHVKCLLAAISGCEPHHRFIASTILGMPDTPELFSLVEKTMEVQDKDAICPSLTLPRRTPKTSEGAGPEPLKTKRS